MNWAPLGDYMTGFSVPVVPRQLTMSYVMALQKASDERVWVWSGGGGRQNIRAIWKFGHLANIKCALSFFDA